MPYSELLTLKTKYFIALNPLNNPLRRALIIHFCKRRKVICSRPLSWRWPTCTSICLAPEFERLTNTYHLWFHSGSQAYFLFLVDCFSAGSQRSLFVLNPQSYKRNAVKKKKKSQFKQVKEFQRKIHPLKDNYLPQILEVGLLAGWQSDVVYQLLICSLWN